MTRKPRAGQLLGDVDPERKRLRPAVEEEDRFAVSGPKHLGVQERPVGGASRDRSTVRRILEHRARGICGDPAHVAALRDRARHRERG